MTIGLYLVINDINNSYKLEEIQSKKWMLKHLLYSSESTKSTQEHNISYEKKMIFLVSVKLG